MWGYSEQELRELKEKVILDRKEVAKSALADRCADFYAEGICEDLQTHLSSLSIESRIAYPCPWSIGSTSVILEDISEYSLGIRVHGSLEVEGHNFDFIQVSSRDEKEDEKRVVTKYHYGYVVRDKVKAPSTVRKSFKGVYLKIHKKGFIHRNMTECVWTGGRLIDNLNSDLELKKLIDGLDKESESLGGGRSWIRNFKSSTLHILPSKDGEFYFLWQPVKGPRDYPSKKDVEIADRVTMHIRAMLSEMF